MKSIEEILAEREQAMQQTEPVEPVIEPTKDTPCQYCGKLYTQAGVSRHEKHCSRNPANTNEPEPELAFDPSLVTVDLEMLIEAILAEKRAGTETHAEGTVIKRCLQPYLKPRGTKTTSGRDYYLLDKIVKSINKHLHRVLVERKITPILKNT